MLNNGNISVLIIHTFQARILATDIEQCSAKKNKSGPTKAASQRTQVTDVLKLKRAR